MSDQGASPAARPLGGGHTHPFDPALAGGYDRELAHRERGIGSIDPDNEGPSWIGQPGIPDARDVVAVGPGSGAESEYRVAVARRGWAEAVGHSGAPSSAPPGL